MRSDIPPRRSPASALTSGSASPDRIAAAIGRVGCRTLDPVDTGCSVHEVDPIELLEVQLCNVTAPFVLVSRLRPAIAAATTTSTW